MHDHGDLLRMMDLIAPTGLPFIIHPHDQALMDYIEGEILARGENTPQGYAEAYAARDGVIWDTACDVLIRLAEASGCHVHLTHMQTRRSIDAVRRAKATGIQVTCEVNHWAPFLGTWEDVETLGPYALSYWIPDEAQEAVWEGLLDGTIDMMLLRPRARTRARRRKSAGRRCGARTRAPRASSTSYRCCSTLSTRASSRSSARSRSSAAAPAEVFGLERTKGAIAAGADADLVVADLNSRWTITNDSVLSRCGWTPYDGRELQRRHRAHDPARPGRLRRRQGRRRARLRAPGGCRDSGCRNRRGCDSLRGDR